MTKAKDPWTKEDIIHEIQHIARMEDTEPYAPNISDRHAHPELRKLRGQARRRFGSWKNAVLAAGLKYKEPERQ
jgi:hypothetical protein